MTAFRICIGFAHFGYAENTSADGVENAARNDWGMNAGK